ncbi:hypothetical protein MCHI_003298 [Candidatus Magnetoovum chiemensis]|nr:hypothetical protein MCHI_003298 [Candidatus Magnetoovum chiemensis]
MKLLILHMFIPISLHFLELFTHFLFFIYDFCVFFIKLFSV